MQAGQGCDGRRRGAALLRGGGGPRRLVAILALPAHHHALCGAHLLRELQGLVGEPGQGWAPGMAELLVDVKLAGDRARAAGLRQVDDDVRARLRVR
jgi:hypothetical protein